jgi:excisionase family DNA binding protein
MVTTLEEDGVGLRSLHEQLDTPARQPGRRSPDVAPEYVHGCGDSRTRLSLQPNGAPAMPDHNEASDEPDALLTPSEVAKQFRVNPKTVTRWARAGKLHPIRTLGGHRRFRASEIRRCLDHGTGEEGRE